MHTMKRQSLSPVFKKSKRFESKTLKCVACSLDHDAELVHPDLRVPICGSCKVSCAQRDTQIRESNEESCIMCGTGDNNELMMCDTCPKSFCSLCIQRNFGTTELATVREASVWQCYICSLSSLLANLQVDEGTVFYSLDRAYEEIKPPSSLPSVMELITSFSPGEALFASLFSNEVGSSIYTDIGIAHYLAAPDVMPILFRLSKKLRQFFRYRNVVLPGLFRTEYGLENLCRLHPHQVISLSKMTEIENRDQTFGALRGGVFADEPGLGKTVTALALISSSVGTMPTSPALFWDDKKINEAWLHLKSQHEGLFAPILNKLKKLYLLDFSKHQEAFDALKQQLRAGSYSLVEVIEAVRHFIRTAAISPSARDHSMSVFNYEITGLKERLDSSRRKSLSATSNRIIYERKLLPSAATLIIVPLALLEHWCEQIMRHLQLSYFLHGSDRSHMRGVVYLDGLGDIMDVEAPLSKVLVRPSIPIESADFLSSYLIVITTLERCALEHRSMNQLGRYDLDNRTSDRSKATSLAERSPLMAIRWLRMIIDEGHEIGRLDNDPANTKIFTHAGEMISQIAAERRWIMSGTPTTGAHSEVGLYQVFQILSFLRHPLYTAMDGKITDVKWRKEIVEPCLMQEPEAWAKVKALLRDIMVRHTKQDIHLFEPINVTVNLDGMPDPSDPEGEAKMLRIDRAKAHYISETIRQALKDWKETLKTPYFQVANRYRRSLSAAGGQRLLVDDAMIDEDERRHQQLLFKARRPKAIVFSQHWSDLQGVGHFLYMMLGESHVCEHTGVYQSAELSRFRHSKRKYRVCPMCGYRNLITSGTQCDRNLILVEYIDVPAAPTMGGGGGSTFAATAAGTAAGDGGGMNTSTAMKPYPAGHGRYSWGSYYRGRCLCSPMGCPLPCRGIPNPFYTLQQPNDPPPSPHLALVSEDHLQNYQPGILPPLGSEVYVTSSEPVPNEETITSIDQAPTPKLWYGGRRGGRAIVRQWRHCGGRNLNHSWHGNKILPHVPWTIEDEDASVLLLQHEGSTGLDLSFATHIFLLERIGDPALRNQLVSRAHRVGATGPVTVSLLQVVASEDD